MKKYTIVYRINNEGVRFFQAWAYTVQQAIWILKETYNEARKPFEIVSIKHS